MAALDYSKNEYGTKEPVQRVNLSIVAHDEVRNSCRRHPHICPLDDRPRCWLHTPIVIAGRRLNIRALKGLFRKKGWFASLVRALSSKRSYHKGPPPRGPGMTCAPRCSFLLQSFHSGTYKSFCKSLIVCNAVYRGVWCDTDDNGEEGVPKYLLMRAIECVSAVKLPESNSFGHVNIHGPGDNFFLRAIPAVATVLSYSSG